MMIRFLPVVAGMVERMYRLRRLPEHVLREDLISAGRLGVLQAVRRELQRDAAFERYVRQCIEGALLDELRREDWLTRRGRWRSNASGGGIVFVGLKKLDHEPSVVEERWLVGRLREQLAKAFTSLHEREAYVLQARYVDDETCEAIARRLGVTTPRVSQITSEALAKLRAALG